MDGLCGPHHHLFASSAHVWCVSPWSQGSHYGSNFHPSTSIPVMPGHGRERSYSPRPRYLHRTCCLRNNFLARTSVQPPAIPTSPSRNSNSVPLHSRSNGGDRPADARYGASGRPGFQLRRPAERERHGHRHPQHPHLHIHHRRRPPPLDEVCHHTRAVLRRL